MDRETLAALIELRAETTAHRMILLQAMSLLLQSEQNPKAACAGIFEAISATLDQMPLRAPVKEGDEYLASVRLKLSGFFSQLQSAI